MKNEEKYITEKLNEFFVKFVLDRDYMDNNVEVLSTKFGIQNEEDNVLYFYYHILDIAKGLVSGSLNMYQLPKHKSIYFETHKYSYHTKELLEEYMNYIKKEIKSYDEFKKSQIVPIM